MKLVRYGWNRAVTAGVLEGDYVRPFTGEHSALGVALSDLDRAIANAGPRQALEDVTLAAPIGLASRVFCVAQNYGAHAQEVSGTDSPPSPIMFMKPSSALIGPGDDIELSRVTTFLDYEGEMAVVIGSSASRVAEAEALDAVYGVTCFNDVSARDLQNATLGGKEIFDWFSAKSLDRSTPIGPWIVSVDELPRELSDLAIQTRLNGEVVQDDRTSSMNASVAQLVSFVSHRVGLWPGDVIATGTPGGVGRARGINLADGDELEVELEGVGTLRNVVREVT
jgi:acylpyruvate hydrolase